MTQRLSGNQEPCVNCGELGCDHEKRKVFPDDGPAGSWHHEYLCPNGAGHYETGEVGQ